MLVVDGEGVTPSTVDVRTLARDLIALDDAIRAAGRVPENEIALSLTGVEVGSLQLDLLVSSHGRAGTDALMAKARSGRFDELPPEAVTQLARIANVHIQAGRTAKLVSGGQSVNITGKHKPPPPPTPAPPVQGTTTLYGIVEGVVLNRYEAQVTLRRSDTGARIVAPAPKSLAKELAARLEEEIGVSGIATWDAASRALLTFQILRVTAYRRPPGPVVSTLEALKASGHFDDIDLDRDVGSDDEDMDDDGAAR